MAAQEIVDRWLDLTRERLPALAAERDWPAHADHGFQRILLDNAAGTKWDEEIPAPAHLNAPDDLLERAIALGEGVAGGTQDLAELDRNSRAWRGE